MSDKFAEENKDFVLKITLEGSSEDDHQTRRVKLPRILDSAGKVSYEELVGLVIRLSFPAVNDASLSNKKKFHKVKLTYHDVDSDLIYLGSTEELMDAFEQYSEQRFVRINAKVERRRSPQRQQQQQQQQQQKRLSGEESNLIDAVTDTNPIAATVSLTSPSLPPQTQTHVTDDIKSNQTDQFHNVVGSIIKILGSASVAIHGTNSSTNSNESMPVPSKKGQKNEPAAKVPKQEVTNVVKSDVNDETRAAVNHVEHAIVHGGLKQPPANDEVKSFPIVNNMNENNGVIKDNHSKKDIKNAAEKNKNKNEEMKVKEKSGFIHGRHTCDLCLVTPIVGARYHATNIPDYDICENCHNSYEGKEIQFEVAELDRDRHLQQRWQRRRRVSERCMRQQRQGQHRERRGKRDFQVPNSTPLPGFRGSRRPAIHNCPRLCGDTPLPLRARTDKSMDFEIKEAIRRSLEDDNINNNVEEKSNATETHIALEKTPVFFGKKEDDAAPAYTEEDGSPLPLKVERAISFAGNEEKKPADTKLTRKSEVEDNGNESKIEFKPQCKEVKNKVVNEQNDNEGKGMKEEMDVDGIAQAKEDEKDALSEMPDLDEDDALTALCKKVVGADVEKAEKVENIVTKFAINFKKKVLLQSQEEKSMENNVENPSAEGECKEKDNSFTSDADGNGSVAGILGETLDKFANGIDEMVLEIHRIDSGDSDNDKSEQDEGSVSESGEETEPSIDSKQENDEVANTNNDTIATDHATEKIGECGGTIIESVKSPYGDKLDAEADEASKENSNDDDWQVVSENRVDVAQNEDTKTIALATQLIGSSLFNSGMESHNSREEENVSALTGCSISTASSVPTNLASSITSSEICLEHSSVYQRWEPQLKQLRELGFDEIRCVGALEKLEAANIGVETPDEEITVAQVVHELFK